MREQLIQYVDLLFAGSPENADMKEEILQNTLDRYDDLVAQGKAPAAAYRLAIGGIGDLGELLGNEQPSPNPIVVTQDPIKKEQKKTMRAVAIGMYICSVLPLLVLSNLGQDVLGLCMMLLLIGSATVLMIMGSNDKEKQAKEPAEETTSPRRRAILKALRTSSVVLFLLLSFTTGAWHVTWLVFPITGAVKGIVNAAMDLKEGKYET